MGERSFIYIFAMYMLLDFVLVKLEKMYIIHHVFCLVGHAVVVFLFPQGMPIYVAGVVAMELGSSAMNLWALYPQSTVITFIYGIGMTVSNIVSVWLAFEWMKLPMPIAP